LSCDTAGLAVLIGTQRRARLLGARICLLAPSPPVAKVLRSTGLDRSFSICAT
jgi:anti-anti-sigma factor